VAAAVIAVAAAAAVATKAAAAAAAIGVNPNHAQNIFPNHVPTPGRGFFLPSSLPLGCAFCILHNITEKRNESLAIGDMKHKRILQFLICIAMLLTYQK
jgi:hypothetical protein